MINIYIGISKNQVSSYEEILQFKEVKKAKNVLISNRTLENNANLWDEVIYADKSFNNQSINNVSAIYNITKKIHQYKQVVKKLKKYKYEKNATLYFTYIEDILTNYLLFSFNKNIKGVVVEDGTLNYYPHTIHSLSKKKVYLKWALSNLYGLRFKLYKGHSSGIESKNVSKQYVRVPELSMFPNKSIKLPYPRRNAILTNTFLIIGQEGYINQLGEKRYIKSVEKLIKLIRSNSSYKDVEKLYYKPHRNGKRIDNHWLSKQLECKEIIFLEPDEPLEDLYFNKLGSSHIFSFDSSALLNIYLESNDTHRKKLNFHVLLRYNHLLEPVFEKFKFNIYK
jgi:hypothetical protein